MNLSHHWQLNPELDFLNHGSFGATPSVVLQALRGYQNALEHDPIEFLAPERNLEPKLDYVRECIAQLIGADSTAVAWVRNATEGVNAVVRSFPFARDAEVVVTNHGYNACINAIRYAAGLHGATVRVAGVPFPINSIEEVVAAIEREFSPRTQLLLVDHVTSPTGLVFPLEPIVASAHSRGIRVLVDGAHALGMLPLNINRIDADYYTSNHHKWLCAPKVSGFLWVKEPLQPEVRPTVISHAANRPRADRSQFVCEFDWMGTYDPSPLLAVPDAIRFLSSLYSGGFESLMQSNRKKAIRSRDILIEAIGVAAPAPDEMLGSLVAIPLPVQNYSSVPEGKIDYLQRRLREQHHFEVPIFPGPEPGSRILRISLQAYNELEQVERLASVLRQELNR